MSETIFKLHNLVKTYKTGAGDFTALDGITLDVAAGEFLGVIGKSGAGKTTLLNLISGVSKITSGEALFLPPTGASQNGKLQPVSIGALDEDELAVWRGQNLGIVYQSFELLPQLNLVNNILLPQEFLGRYLPRISHERALALLDMVGLKEHAYKLPAHISGGQKQRVAIARALVNDPPVIVADEPTGNLDSVTAATVFGLFSELVCQGKTVIMVTHDMNLASRFSRCLLISDGKLVDELQAEHPADGEATSVEAVAVNGKVTAGEPLLVSTYTARDETVLRDHATSAIVLRDVVKTYVNAAGSFTALKGIDIDIKFGEFVSLVGKSGSGKSTLLNMLTGIDHPTSGEVTIDGEDIYRLSESQRARWRGRTVGIVFQFFQLLPTLSLLENTMLPMDYCNVYPSRERPERALALLKMVGLEDHAYDMPASVSNGQQQAAAVARSLATDPPIIVADEPTGNLDSRSADVVIRVFRELAARGKTILIVTHDPSLTSRTDRSITISDGEIIDPTLARALPILDHPQMLRATHLLERRVYAAGETVIRAGESVDHLYMLASGRVAVLTNGAQTPAIHLEPGQHFGEVELLGDDAAIANVVADTRSVELQLLPKEAFFQIINESPPTIESLKRVARERRAENFVHSRTGTLA
ncbi:MAG: ATP-binding cassette domain-containing protein [Anaerolineales bacterium]